MPSHIFTVGHSTRTLEELIELLEDHGVTLLADVRTLPGSRHVPHFNQESLDEALATHRIVYQHLKELGGLRRPHRDSPNLAWRNASFRGYADYMQTDAWRLALQHLIDLSSSFSVAVMCSEAVPWRCHRNLISDGLTVRGVLVDHIISKTKTTRHAITSFAHVDAEHITYPSTGSLESEKGQTRKQQSVHKDLPNKRAPAVRRKKKEKTLAMSKAL